MSQSNTGRFYIGQKIIVVAFRNTSPNKRSGPAHIEWEARPVSPMEAALYGSRTMSIKFEVLEVKEHHKVAWDQDPKGKKDCDGYILTDSQGNIYHNQYPAASYGQTTDTANWRFHRSYDHIPKDENRQKAVRAMMEDPKNPWEWNSVSHTMDDLTPPNSFEQSIKQHNDKVAAGEEGTLNTAAMARLVQTQAALMNAFKDSPVTQGYRLAQTVIHSSVSNDGKPYEIKRWTTQVAL